VRAAALDHEAQLRRLTASLRAELVRYGVDKVVVSRMSLERLLRTKRRVVGRLMGAPGPKGWS